jgi:hypothetical protein
MTRAEGKRWLLIHLLSMQCREIVHGKSITPVTVGSLQLIQLA